MNDFEKYISIESISISTMFTYETFYSLLIKTNTYTISIDHPHITYHLIPIGINELTKIQSPKGIIDILQNRSKNDIIANNILTISKNSKLSLLINGIIISKKELISILNILNDSNEIQNI